MNIFDGLTQEERKKILDDSIHKVFKKNEMIFDVGKSIEYLYVLIDGQIAVQKDTEHGTRNIMAIISKPMDCFGEVYFFLDQSVPLSAMAMKSSEVCLISKDEIFKNPQISLNLNIILANKADTLAKKMQILTQDSLREKVLEYIQQHPEIHLKRYELANFLGVSRPALSKEIALLQDEGLIIIDETGIMKLKR